MLKLAAFILGSFGEHTHTCHHEHMHVGRSCEHTHTHTQTHTHTHTHKIHAHTQDPRTHAPPHIHWPYIVGVRVARRALRGVSLLRSQHGFAQDEPCVRPPDLLPAWPEHNSERVRAASGQPRLHRNCTGAGARAPFLRAVADRVCAVCTVVGKFGQCREHHAISCYLSARQLS